MWRSVLGVVCVATVMTACGSDTSDLEARISELEAENENLRGSTPGVSVAVSVPESIDTATTSTAAQTPATTSPPVTSSSTTISSSTTSTTTTTTTTTPTTTTTTTLPSLSAEELASAVAPTIAEFLRADPGVRDGQEVVDLLSALSADRAMPAIEVFNVNFLSDGESQTVSLDAAVTDLAEIFRLGEGPFGISPNSVLSSVVYDLLDEIPTAGPSVIGSGVFRVGTEPGNIAPGTYVTWDVDGCYWERQDSAAEIVDNNFISSALRAEVSIQDTDFGFLSEDCGTWIAI